MVIHAFPVAKLGALLIKQISKPIANAVKQGAKSSPVFRKYVCLPPAQFYNWCEVKVKMWLLHLGQPVNITVLNEAASIELGANLLGETVIFIIAAGVLLAEYNRSARKEAAKEEARKLEIRELQTALRDLFIQTEQQGAYIRELTRKVGDLETRTAQGSLTLKPAPKEPPSQEPPQHEPKYEELSPERKEDLININLMKSQHNRPLKGVVFKAISEVENVFFDYNREKESGIIMEALNHLYKNVYKSPLTF